MIVERFLQWSKTAPTEKRAEAANALARSYLVSPLSEVERDQVEAAMTVLLDDPEPEVRESLADALAASDKAPHHIVLSLAADHPAIAAKVIGHSPVILDSELVDLSAAASEDIQIAVASRPYVSRAVAAALAEVGTAAANLAMIRNPGARLPRFSMERIIARHGGDFDICETLLERQDLPLDLRHVLVERAADSLCNVAVSRSIVPAERAEAAKRDVCERAIIAMASESAPGELPGLVRALIRESRLTPAFLIRVAASGQVRLFETAIAELSAIPVTRVRALSAAGRESGLRALLARAGMPDRTHEAFAVMLRILHAENRAAPDTDYRRATRLVDAIIERYGARPDREVNGILMLLRRFATDAKRSAARGYVAELLEAA